MSYRLSRLTGAALLDFVASVPREESKLWIDLFAYDRETETAISRIGTERKFPSDDVYSVTAVRVKGSLLDVACLGVTVSRDRWRYETVLDACGISETI